MNVFFNPSPEKCLDCTMFIATRKGRLCFSFSREKILHDQAPVHRWTSHLLPAYGLKRDVADRKGKGALNAAPSIPSRRTSTLTRLPLRQGRYG